MGLRIRFLGTGGGRYVTAYQWRRTGGILVEKERLYHIDPGPGATRALKDFGEDVRRVDVLVITHNHPDHVTEAPVVVEGMTEGTRRRRGTILAPKSVLEGLNDYKPLSSYHQSLVERVVEARPGEEAEGIRFLPARHTDPHTVGLLLGEVTYFSDTGYWEGMERFVRDIVIFNLETLSPSPYHTTFEVVRKVLERSSPSLVMLTHFGMSVLREGPEKIGKQLEREFGVDVIVAEDGMEWRKGRTILDF